MDCTMENNFLSPDDLQCQGQILPLLGLYFADPFSYTTFSLFRFRSYIDIKAWEFNFIGHEKNTLQTQGGVLVSKEVHQAQVFRVAKKTLETD